MTSQKDTSTVKALLRREDYQNRFKEILGTRAAQFAASVVNISRDSNVAECDPHSVIAAAIVAATLDLPIDKNLGFAWIVPYKESGTPRAQFQLGAKGVIQLAMRSGQYTRMNAKAINAEAFCGLDTFGEPIIKWDKLDETKPAIGYVFAWELVNGFRKTTFWSKEKVEAHAARYSMAFRKGRTSPWQTHPEQMALKTIIKNELSDWGILSVEMQKAFRHDQGIQTTIESDVVYVDNAQDGSVKLADVSDLDPQARPMEKVKPKSESTNEAPASKAPEKAPESVSPPAESQPGQESPATPAQDAAAPVKSDGQEQPAQPEQAQTAEPAPAPIVVKCRYCQQDVQDMSSHECEPMKEAIEKAGKDPIAEGALTLDDLTHLMQQVGVTEAQVLAFCVHSKLARKDQKLRQLSNAKLRDLTKAIVNPDGVVLGKIKKIAV